MSSTYDNIFISENDLKKWFKNFKLVHAMITFSKAGKSIRNKVYKFTVNFFSLMEILIKIFYIDALRPSQQFSVMSGHFQVFLG